MSEEKATASIVVSDDQVEFGMALILSCDLDAREIATILVIPYSPSKSRVFALSSLGPSKRLSV